MDPGMTVMRDESGPTVETQWARVRGKLRAEFGEVAYRSWLKPLTLAGVDDGEVKIAVPTRFMQDWVRTHYAERLRALWKAENKNVRAVEIVVASPAAAVRPILPAQPRHAVPPEIIKAPPAMPTRLGYSDGDG